MKAEPDQWKHLPFSSVSPVPYSRVFSGMEYERLAQGLIPQAMEDKCFMYLEDFQLKFYHSWTGQAVYQVNLREVDDNYRVDSALCSDEVLERSDSEYQATLLDFLISNLLLSEHKPFPRPVKINEKMPGAYQHAISGTGYRETISACKPWWRFW
ncbi:hypothetical protein GGQ80_003514 [Sphingomonas jinjuensis]|uniref:Uncharacterized protein n=1 Tax=Sphingomonas jinjuensis TaxID=535907 RepID=A0A840FDA7_9SPHN|nr:hypothetical protein [Sphingomonas jinjuensis]MBB4155589.1 hypothetical protein [Sphingomonas jinjuensis]